MEAIQAEAIHLRPTTGMFYEHEVIPFRCTLRARATHRAGTAVMTPSPRWMAPAPRRFSEQSQPISNGDDAGEEPGLPARIESAVAAKVAALTEPERTDFCDRLRGRLRGPAIGQEHPPWGRFGPDLLERSRQEPLACRLIYRPCRTARIPRSVRRW